MKLKRLKLKVSAIKANAGLPQIPITVTSGGVLSRSGSTVNWTPWTYSVAGLDTNTVTFVLDGVDQAPGAITFPYTLAAGHTLGARGVIIAPVILGLAQHTAEHLSQFALGVALQQHPAVCLGIARHDRAKDAFEIRGTAPALGVADLD